MDKKLLILIKLFFCLFLIIPKKALASDFQWLKVLKTEDGNIFYVDKKSINKKKDKVFFIKLHEYSDFNKYGEKSSIIHHKVDCKNPTTKWFQPTDWGLGYYLGFEKKNYESVYDDFSTRQIFSFKI